MDPTKPEEFDVFASRLERLAQLKERNLLEDDEYKDLRGALFGEMKRAMVAPQEVAAERSKAPQPQPSFPVPYGKLHTLIVDQVASAHAGGADNAKERMFRAMSVMAAKQALYHDDSRMLTRVIEVVSSPMPAGALGSTPGATDHELLKRLAELNEIAGEISSSRDASPAAKAIAETAQQSTTKAAQQLGVERSKEDGANTSAPNFWKKFVLKDVDGAFEGGAAAVTVAPAMVGLFSVPLATAAAFGVVVVAGVRSAIAQIEG